MFSLPHLNIKSIVSSNSTELLCTAQWSGVTWRIIPSMDMLTLAYLKLKKRVLGKINSKQIWVLLKYVASRAHAIRTCHFRLMMNFLSLSVEMTTLFMSASVWASQGWLKHCSAVSRFLVKWRITRWEVLDTCCFKFWPGVLFLHVKS